MSAFHHVDQDRTTTIPGKISQGAANQPGDKLPVARWRDHATIRRCILPATRSAEGALSQQEWQENEFGEIRRSRRPPKKKKKKKEGQPRGAPSIPVSAKAKAGRRPI